MTVYCGDLGQMDYKACWDLQQSLFDVLTAGETTRTAAPESDAISMPAPGWKFSLITSPMATATAVVMP